MAVIEVHYLIHEGTKKLSNSKSSKSAGTAAAGETGQKEGGDTEGTSSLTEDKKEKAKEKEKVLEQINEAEKVTDCFIGRYRWLLLYMYEPVAIFGWLTALSAVTVTAGCCYI